jgi:hypothetical protein
VMIEMISIVFQEFSFSYINRSCSKVVYCLARRVTIMH